MKGQSPIAIIFTVALSLLGISGTGFFYLNSQVADDGRDIATLQSESREYREDIGEVRADIKDIKDLLMEIAIKDGVRKTQMVATSTVNVMPRYPNL